MIHFPWIGPSRPLSRAERPKRTRDLRFQAPECREKLKKIDRVAVVGGGFAGLMAARRLVQHGIKVTVYEARQEVGGRVLSNPKFSEGRITEAGAELIGSFHTRWLELARECGLAMISRMDPELYERACLDVRLTLDKPLSIKEFWWLTKAMEERVLMPLAEKAKKEINDPSKPWLQSALRQYDNMSVQEALPKYCQVAERKTNKDEPLWKMLEFKLVNDEVAPLDEMNFLGLLCKVRGGQSERCVEDDDIRPSSSSLTDGYWQELEIFRCADGCQTLAKTIAAKIQTKEYGPEPARVTRLVAVTNIDLSGAGVTLGLKATRPDGKFVDDKPPIPKWGFSYVILAMPPSVWSGVKITADGENADPAKEIGQMRMNEAVKHFSKMKERFWIKEKPAPTRDRGSAPYGGSLRIGQVWEGTDNQTRVGSQGIVLSVFAGPVSSSRRAPTQKDIEDELPRLFPGARPHSGYASNLIKPTLFSDWPNAPFIKTGYWAPYPGEIFRVGEKLTKPYHDRLFFAGEHTEMAFFGYMEGALRSGERAAEALMVKACGLHEETAPKPEGPVRVARAAPAREIAALGRDVAAPAEKRGSTGDPGEAESPFLERNLFAAAAEQEWEPRVAALVAESPYAGGIEDRRGEEEAADELEDDDELEAGDAREELEDDELTSQPDQEEEEFLDDEGAPGRNDETKLEPP
jgi:monoamine oxidase